MNELVVVFDCDGVIREISMRELYNLYIMIGEECGYDLRDTCPSFGTFCTWYSHNWRWNMERMGIMRDEDIGRANDLFHTYYEPRMRLFDWVEEMFGALAQKCKVAICSNSSTHSVRRSINGFIQNVSLIVGYDSVKNLKPHPEGLHLIRTHFDVPYERMIMIGDTQPDIDAGRNAGVGKTIAVAWGATEEHDLLALGADHIVYDEMQLYEQLIS